MIMNFFMSSKLTTHSKGFPTFFTLIGFHNWMNSLMGNKNWVKFFKKPSYIPYIHRASHQYELSDVQKGLT